MGSSERLRELRDLEKQLEQDKDFGEISEREVNLGAGSFRVVDGNEAGEEERKGLLRRQAAAKERARLNIEPWKVWVVVAITIVSCAALLWALFSGATPDKFMGSSPGSGILTASELEKQHAEGGRESKCPDAWWIVSFLEEPSKALVLKASKLRRMCCIQRLLLLQPDECKDHRRTESKTAMDRCNEMFEKNGYSLDLLKECNIIQSDGR